MLASDPVLRLLGMSQFFIIIAIISTFVAATTLLIYDAIDTYRLVS